MKRYNLLLVTGIAVMLTACVGKKQSEPAAKAAEMDHSAMVMAEAEKSKIQGGERVIYYTCPMDSHKHIHSSQPGTCSECNMKLVAGVVTLEEMKDYYGCPMEAHSHVRSDSPGTCEGCGMKLKPMRLVKS